MISYLIYIIILLILIFVSVIAIKAMIRGIKVKKNLKKDDVSDQDNKKNN